MSDNSFATIEEWSPETVDVDLEVGIRGVCDHCDEDLHEYKDDSPARVWCPSCGLVIGLVFRYPDLTEGGEPGEKVDWPTTGVLSPEDADWEVEYGLRGTHTDGEFVSNEEDSQYPIPGMACDGCGVKLGYAANANVVQERSGESQEVES